MKVLIIGGGPGGMMAAFAAARDGAEVILTERNEKLGKKLYITGKGRCNFANTAPREEFFVHVVTNPKFLYSAVSALDAEALRAFFLEFGVESKVERGGRVFPVSDKSSDCIRALDRAMARFGVEVRLNERVSKILTEGGRACGVITGGGKIAADAVILATGGMSYPATGSDGDGYRLAKELGHRIVTPRPALVALECAHGVQEGLALKNVSVSVSDGARVLATVFGEMLFTKTGVSGPAILTLSSKINRYNNSGLSLSIDLKPALNAAQLDARVLRDFEIFANKNFENSLSELLPQSLIRVIVERSEIPADKKVHQISAAERRRLCSCLKALRFPLIRLGGFDSAVVTAGGVDTCEVSPSSMESKLVKGLYFAGEVLDVDALTGGYNLQIAFATGYLAGTKCLKEDGAV